MHSNPLSIGTRGSPLALAQANEVRNRLMSAHGLPEEAFPIEVIKTSGDRFSDRPLAEIGGKGLFTKEIEEALLDGHIDFAVHSAKDMPTELPAGLVLSCFLEREDVRDGFIGRASATLDGLPQGATVGSSSLRRQALVKRQRPDLDVCMFRGNVQTRLRKLDEGVADATLLANAGLKRLGMEDVITELLDVERFPPAPGQGAICVEQRANDIKTRTVLDAIDHAGTRLALLCERAFLAALDGSCRTPIAALARIDGERLNFHGVILTPDGKISHEINQEGDTAQAEDIGRRTGAALRERAGSQFFEGWT